MSGSIKDSKRKRLEQLNEEYRVVTEALGQKLDPVEVTRLKRQSKDLELEIDQLERELAGKTPDSLSTAPAGSGKQPPPRPVWPALLVGGIVVVVAVILGVWRPWVQKNTPPTSLPVVYDTPQIMQPTSAPASMPAAAQTPEPTTAPSVAPTQAPSEPQQPAAQPQAPEVLSSGNPGLKGNSGPGVYYVDLDTGNITGEPTGDADFLLSSEPWIVPKNSAQVAKVDTRMGDTGCSAQPLSEEIIPLSNVDIIGGVWFCAKTTDNHLSEFWLQKVNTDTFDFAFTYRTWK